ncbi:MAG: EAL domain-containing protein [Butyrivibrio sp.]|nr:EAL domain-containing protein [Muribaculum sp.]MCM1552971.1 EAL domain-containing protein [Butyrivibrio sp.]
MRKRNDKRHPLVMIIVGLAIVFASLGFCSFGIRSNLEKEMEDTLRDIAAQNVLAINNEIIVQYKLLLGFASELQEYPEREEEIVQNMSAFVESYGFRRMGYAHADGVALTTDGYTADLSGRNFFQHSMEGKIWITAAQEEQIAESGGAINVFSLPVYGGDGEEPTGVIFATYDNELFQDMLDIDFLNGQGSSCIITTNGDIIALSNNSPLQGETNFLTHIMAEDVENSSRRKNSDIVQKMRSVMASGGSDIGRCEDAHEAGNASIFYYRPVNENIYGGQWYMLAIVPETVLEQRIAPVMRNVRIFAGFMFVVAFAVLSFYLYTERKRQKELVSLAYQDALTGGYNFACFRESSKARTGLAGYVVALDLAEFKLVNSSFGVQKGDETLLELWKVLRENVSDTEMVARVNADRFVLFLHAESKEALEERLDGLVEQIEGIAQRLKIPALFPVFGVYYAQSLDEPDKYYGFAVQAKHLIKGRRDRHYAFYEEIDYKRVLEEKEMENSFSKAIEDEEFEIWYQPKFSAQEGDAIGAEALVRWRKSNGSMLSPGRFIPLFERNGNIAALDEYIFRKVCAQQKAWLEKGYEVLPVSVNISRVSLYFGDIVENYEKIMADYGLDSKYIQLEITESATVDNTDIAGLIERFHKAGFIMLLDDFGSGYSSLASLNTLHFDTLKLDKSLIDFIGDESGEKLLEHITKLGQSLGLHITAEGVETEKQLVFLKTLCCDDIQGYYFSKPLSMEDYGKRIINMETRQVVG